MRDGFEIILYLNLKEIFKVNNATYILNSFIQ